MSNASQQSAPKVRKLKLTAAMKRLLNREFAAREGSSPVPKLRFDIEGFGRWPQLSVHARRQAVQAIQRAVQAGLAAINNILPRSTLPLFQRYVSLSGARLRSILGPWTTPNLILTVAVCPSTVVVSVKFVDGHGGDDPRPPVVGRSSELTCQLEYETVAANATALEPIAVDEAHSTFPSGGKAGTMLLVAERYLSNIVVQWDERQPPGLFMWDGGWEPSRRPSELIDMTTLNRSGGTHKTDSPAAGAQSRKVHVDGLSQLLSLILLTDRFEIRVDADTAAGSFRDSRPNQLSDQSCSAVH